MKPFLLLSIIFCCTFKLNAQVAPTTNPNQAFDTSKKSLRAIAIKTIGKDSFKIKYSSPGVRNRVIWGRLVPYGEVWVTGAHNATTLEISRSIKISGITLAPGKYAIFTIPGKDEWTFIINKNWEQHLAWDYSAEDDLLRLKVKPRPGPHLERLQYFIEDGKISMAWEKLRIEIPFKVVK